MLPLQYVVLRHEGIADPHYDLMVETSSGSALATFRIDRWPVAEGDALSRIGDHRRDYLNYEGPISGGRGSVRCVQRGTFRFEHLSPDRWRLRLESGAALEILGPSGPVGTAGAH